MNMQVDIRDDFIDAYMKLGFTEQGMKVAIDVAIHSHLLLLKNIVKADDTWWHKNLIKFVDDCNNNQIKFEKLNL